MSSSEARLLVVFRDGLGGHYGKSFSYPVSLTRSARYELKDFELKENILSFLVVPTEGVMSDVPVPVKQWCVLDIVTGKIEMIEYIDQRTGGGEQ